MTVRNMYGGSLYSSYIISGPTGEIGVVGPVGPSGPTGTTGSGISGPVGRTGIGVSFADGTADTSLYIQLEDGLVIQHDNVSVRGNPDIAGTIQIENLGTGVNFVKGVSGDIALFRSFKFSNDYTITRQENDIIASVDTTSGGTASVMAGLKNELIYMSGVTLASGATFTYYGTGGGVAESQFISATFKDHTSIIKGATGISVDAGYLYTFVPASKTSLSDANIILIDQNKFQLDGGVSGLTWKTFYDGPTFNSEYISTGLGTGPAYSNALYATFVIKTPNQDMNNTLKTGISFGYINIDEFDSRLLGKNSYNILNCMSFNNGITWDCFQPGAGYTHEYSDLYSPGSCCYEDDCYDYMTLKGCLNIGGEYKENVVCDDDVCGTDITGACCTNDICVKTTQGQCEKYSGKWFSEQECDYVPCAPVCSEIGIGACCFPFGQCNDRLYREYCELVNGTYQGDGTYCWEIDCCEATAARGSCCVGNQCLFVSAHECHQAGGMYYGPDKTCQDVDCCDISIQSGMCCCQDGTCIDNVSAEYCDSPSCDWSEDSECLTDCEDYTPNVTDCERGMIVVDFEEASASIDNYLQTKTYFPTMEEGYIEIPYQIIEDPYSNYDKVKITGITFDNVEYTNLGGPLDNIIIKLKGVNHEDQGGDEIVKIIYDDTYGISSPLNHEIEYTDLYANSDFEIVMYANRWVEEVGHQGVFDKGKLLIHIECLDLDVHFGACCLGLLCDMMLSGDCAVYGGDYLGDGTTCEYEPPDDPPCGTPGGGG